ncbi:MAG: hypothetical protein AB1696_21955 [Planctomycetota bacterium]
MKTSAIAGLLDREFRIEATADPGMTKHALTEYGRAFVLPAFHERKTGLMFDFTKSVNITYCVTFTTSETLTEILKAADGPTLIFTHHPFDCHEDNVNLIGGTHYNTEKWAVRDVARFLNQNGIPARFVEDPVLSKYEEGNFRIR